MPDIDNELNTIANEPKGRLVKQAIYDALLKINAAADIRPPAKREVPIGDIVCDTGFVSQWVIGDVTVSEPEYLADIQNGAETSTPGVYQTVSDSVYATSSGLAFLVTENDWDESGTAPVVTDSSSVSLTWTQVASFESKMKIRDGGDGSIISEEDFVDAYHVKGIVRSYDELPESPQNGDVYICPSDPEYVAAWDARTYGNHIFWTYLSNYVTVIPPGSWFRYPPFVFEREVSRRITVWAATVSQETGINVTVESSDGAATAGVFFIPDTESSTVSEMDYSIRLLDLGEFYGVKEYDENATYKGEVENEVALAELGIGEEGDTYYVKNVDTFYKWYTSEGIFDIDPVMYYTYSDYTEEGATAGLSDGTRKIFVVVSLVPFSNFGAPMSLMRGLHNADKIVGSSGSPCTMSAWIQKPTDTSTVFTYSLGGRELYYWAYNGSVAVIPIEIGGSIQNGNTNS